MDKIELEIRDLRIEIFHSVHYAFEVGPRLVIALYNNKFVASNYKNDKSTI